ncbi:MAG: ammonium transporter [Candidatus Hadarchaeia archaeon]
MEFDRENGKKVLPLVIVIVLFVLTNTPTAMAQDPTGTATDTPSLDYVWLLVSAALVMFMQPGFAMLEAGFVRAKNVVNILAKNLMDFCLGALAFFAVGYALMMGTDAFGIIGTDGFFLLNGYDVGIYLNFLFMMVFAATAATIVSGAVAGRMKFKAYFVYTICITALIYPIYAHWVWGGGWLSELSFGLGHLDFAGSGVVHAMGGFIGLAGAVALGPRFGKFRNGEPRAIPGHNMSLAALGTFILWFGWFGFNAGSTLTAQHLRISVIATNTALAAAAGGTSAMFISKWKTDNWDVGMALNGVLAGLVAVTAPCAWIEGWSAIMIGLIGGAVMFIGVRFIESRGIDDPVGAVSVHGLNGLWGLIAVGIFADGTYGNYAVTEPFVEGLLYGGGVDQLIAQFIGAGTVFIYAFGVGYVLFKAMEHTIGIRADPEAEIEGLDLTEHGAQAYPEEEGGI